MDTSTTPRITRTNPSAIAAAVQTSRPDLAVDFGTTGGNVLCIVARYVDHASPHVWDGAVYVGLASGNLGWSDTYGDNFGEWADLLSSDADHARWQEDSDLDVASFALAIARIAAVLFHQLPPSPFGDGPIPVDPR